MPRKATKKGQQKNSPEINIQQKEKAAFIQGLRKQGLIGNINKRIDFISTGSWVLNRLIGDTTHKNQPGGIPRGFITEIYGGEATGKTTLALHIAKQALLKGETVVYADFEQSLRSQRQYVQNMGIEISEDSTNFIHIIPESLQEGAKAIGQCLVKLQPSVIIIDSVTTMMPKDTIDKDADETTAIGQHARLVGSFINWIDKKLQKYNTALVLINQLRSNIKSSKYEPGPAQITTGGKAIPYFATVRIKLRATYNQKKVKENSLITGISEDKAVSQEVKVFIEKNKLDMPFKSGPIYIVFGHGIDNIMSLITLGVNKKLIKRKGAYYTWKDPNSDLEFNCQGEMNLKKHLIENPKILEALKPYLIPTRDEQEMETIKSELEEKGAKELNASEREQLIELRKIKGEAVDDLQLSDQQKESLEELNGITEQMSGVTEQTKTGSSK